MPLSEHSQSIVPAEKAEDMEKETDTRIETQTVRQKEAIPEEIEKFEWREVLRGKSSIKLRFNHYH